MLPGRYEQNKIPSQTILSFVSFIGFLFFVLFWLDQQERFPELGPGYYSGSIRGITPSEDSIYLHVREKHPGRFVFLGENPRLVNVSFDPIPYFEKRCCKSLNVKSDKFDFTFNGSLENNFYQGKVYEEITNKYGSWKLVRDVPEELSEKELKKIREYISYDELRDKKNFYLKKDAEQRSQIETLKGILIEKQKLKGVAANKFKSEESILEVTRLKYEKQRKIVEKLRKQVELGQRITPLGRLTAVSRETIEKDQWWMSGALGFYPDNPDIAARTYRMRRILMLQDEIAKFKGVKQ